MRTLVLSGTILLAVTATAAAQTADPVGEWLVEDGTRAHQGCELPAGTEPAADALGRDLGRDDSPASTRRIPIRRCSNRPMLGVPILINMKQTEANRWDGKIYDATRRQHLYDSNISLNRNDMLAGPRLRRRHLLRRSGLEARHRHQHAAACRRQATPLRRPRAAGARAWRCAADVAADQGHGHGRAARRCTCRPIRSAQTLPASFPAPEVLRGACPSAPAGTARSPATS